MEQVTRPTCPKVAKHCYGYYKISFSFSFLLEGRQMAGVPAPAQMGSIQILADRRLGVASVPSVGTLQRHQVPFLADAVNGGVEGLK